MNHSINQNNPLIIIRASLSLIVNGSWTRQYDSIDTIILVPSNTISYREKVPKPSFTYLKSLLNIPTATKFATRTGFPSY
jgi:hypothetical protein